MSGNPKYDYTKIDPILKKDLDISFKEFQKKCEIKVHKWTFLARKKFLKGESGYGRTIAPKKKEKKVSGKTYTKGKITVKDGRNLSIREIISEIYPSATKVHELSVIAEAFIENPMTTHSSMKRAGKINISDSFFYQFRRKFTTLVGLKPNGKRGVTTKGNSGTIKSPRKKNVLYQTIFQKEIGKNHNPKSLELLQEFIEQLNMNRQSLELIQISSPVPMIEIREVSK